jgi:gliding motility-associated lipoprotein GldH
MKSFPFFRLLLTILVVGSMCFLTSCRKDVVYSQFCSIPSEIWIADEVASFDYKIEDIHADYRMLVYVRHTERYPYQNMWLFIDDSRHKDTIEFYLADDRGQWLGDKHHGFIEMQILLEENYHFADTGMYHMTIQHGMRDSLLRGVTDIGFEVVKSEN